MKPYYESWKESAHNQTNCLKCHYEPGIKGHLVGKFKASAQLVTYVTKTYGSKPNAEVSDASCLRDGCHLKAKLFEREVPFKEQILFSHQQHLEGVNQDIQLRCTSCHSHIKEGEHFSVAESVCFTCHFQKGAEEKAVTSCGSCHGAPQEKIVRQGVEIEHGQFLQYGAKCETCHGDVTKGEGKVSEERCLSCHDRAGKEFRDSQFLHDTHVTERKVECFECHEEIEHGAKLVNATTSSECSQCHSRQHTVSEGMYRGTGVSGVKSQPSVMFKTKVDCNGCHLYPREEKMDGFAESVQLAKPEACDTCHGESFGQMIVPTWQSSTRDSYNKAEKRLGELKAKIEGGQNLGLSETELNEVRNLYRSARNKLDFVKADGSWGVHNLEYAETVLDKAKEDLEKGLRLLGKGERK